MTTAGPRTPTSPVVPGARGGVLLTVLLAVVAGGAAAVTDGRPGVLGAWVGAALVGSFFLFGAASTAYVAAYAPAASLLVALLTYTLQVLVLGLVFWGLTRSGATEHAVHAGWLGGTVIAGTFAWLLALVRGAVRRRLPAYDVPLPAPGRAREVGR